MMALGENGEATNPVTRPFSVLIWSSRDLETLCCFGAALVAFVQFSDRGKTERQYTSIYRG